jgi:tRNA dimethylallyltransferase
MNTHLHKQKILIILGPTAVGKSSLAVELAREFNGEIISADSRQVYRGLNIGTGKITPVEMQGILHHLLDIADPHERFSVVEFVVLTEQAIVDISSRGKLPIICGGTGFYIQALVDGISLPEVPANEELRTELEAKELPELAQKLESLDPRRAADMQANGDIKNKRRIIRALEIIAELGEVPPLSNTTIVNYSGVNSIYDPLFIGLMLPPEQLREKIRTRLLSRMEAGMIEEVQSLHQAPPIGIDLSWKRMDELGLEYRYVAQHLQGQLTLEEMIEKLGTEIWHYAKRQMTWFKRDARIQWFAPDTKDRELIMERVRKFL